MVNMSRPLKKPRAVYPLEDALSDENEMETDNFVGQTVSLIFCCCFLVSLHLRTYSI